nr:nonribosomal peptide synthetase 11147 [Ostreopsis cf. ovata]
MSVYILYTSGTTGRPKGCDIPHRGLVGRTQWLQNTWPLGPDDVVAQKTPATFAISEWELFWPLCMGAKMALAADGLHGDAQHVVDLLSLHKVSHSVFVPSLLDQLLDELNGRDLPDLKLIIACGEALKAGTAVACLKGLPGTELVNLYGPTEASMTMLRLPSSPTVEALYRCPLGLPIENTTVLVGSEKGAELSPLLAQGEIFFGGAFLCKGYWQQLEITKEKFVPNPHGPGELYCTGDLGRWRADGCLEFLGRADSQVKFNGVRIELAEIEGALASLPGVKQAAAFLAPPFHLVAACTLLATAGDVLGGPPSDADRSKLMEGLRTALPKDRVPTRLEVLPTFPLTDRGKVDRKKLLADFQAREAERMATRTVSPPALELGSERSPVEFKVEQLMRDVLGVLEPLPMSTSFQDLGFSSLLLGQLTTRLRRTFALPALPATAVYKHPTGTSLSDCIEQLLAEQVDSCSEDCELLVPACPVWQGDSPTSALSWACTVLGLFLDCVVSEFAFLPAYYLFFEVYFRFGLWFLCIAAAPIIFLDLLLSMLVVASLKWVVVGRRREATFPVFSWEYWKWRLMHCIEAYAEQHFSTLLTDTPLYNVFLRLQGATIGHGVRINFGHLSEVDLITIGAGSRLERDAKLNCARLWNGQLHLRPIHIGQGCLISHRGHVVAGTSLPPNTELTPMSSSDHFGPHSVRPRGQSMEPRSDDKVLHFLQLTVGIPLLLLVDALSHLPVFLTLEWLWNILSKRLSMSSREARKFVRKVRGRWGWGWISGHKAGYTLEDKQRVLVPFVLLIPWVMTFIHGGAYFLLVVLLKKFFIGEFKEGHQISSWDRFRHWLMERLATSVTFSHFMELWVNTEVLSACYRMLGANVAHRVNMDFFGAVEYDLLTIETDVVFGSAVLLVNTAGGFSRSITLRRGACVLDHSCVMPGTVVPEGALLGSFTVVPSGQSLEAMTVYMGNEQGKCVKLFQRPLLPGEQIEGERVVVREVGNGNGRAQTPPLPPVAARQRALEAQALMHHWSSTFYVFNAWCGLSAVLFAPLTDMVYWATIIIDFEVYDYFGNSDLGELAAVLLIPVLYLLVTFGMLLVLCTLKWLLIGRWKAGDRHYYSWFHFRWAALMVAFSSLDDLMESIAGTYFAVLFMRAMGASVGERVCFFGHGFEYDLLHIGDEVCIGPDCDVTCHTVENMVMRMQMVRFERGSSCLAGAVAMPGAMLEQGATLIEHSQVLKGETVPQGSYFGGLPAKLLRGYKSLAGRSPSQELPSARQQQHRRSPMPGRQSSGAGLLPLLAENNPSILVEMSTLTPVSDVSPGGNNVAYSTLGEHPYL